MKQVFKHELVVVAALAVLLVGLAVLGVLASRTAPDVQVLPGINSSFPRPAKPVPAPTDRTAP